MDIRFDGQVAVVTGAGNGLGRSHALEFARRGAKVVVNDFGVTLDGRPASSNAADAVVAEILAAGGEAIANAGSVTSDEDVAALVKQTMDAWGRCDILVNNAGSLRDKSFPKMSMADFEFVVDVHLIGTARVTQAFWPIMKTQQYGRVVFTTSAAGLYGNFGQANYGAAKMGMIGLMHVLMIEGLKDNIRVNAIGPVAATRMSIGTQVDGGVELERLASAGMVTQGVIVLCTDDAPSGLVMNAGGASFSAFKMFETEGVFLGREGLTAEKVKDALPQIVAEDILHHRINAQAASHRMFSAGDA